MGGLARRAGLVESIKEQEPNVLLLDAGNAFGDSTDGDVHQQAQVMIKGLALMNYDALNLGEDALSLGQPFLDERQREARFSLLSANLIDRETSRPAYTPYVIQTTGSLQVGIIGLASPTLWPEEADGAWQIADPLAALSTLLPQVREQATLVVVLARLPFAEALDLAHHVQGVDVMIVAPGDGAAPALSEVNGTLVLSAGQEGQVVGRLQLIADVAGQILSYRVENVTLDESIKEDAGVLALMAQSGRP